MKHVPLVFFVALAACARGGDDADGPEPHPVALVTLARAERGAVDETIALYGVAEARPEANVTLSAPAEATLERVVAAVGVPVAKGQLVAVLSASPTTRVELAKASADARAADAAYARQQRLRADGLVGDAEVESARSAAQGLDAAFASLSHRVAALDVRATAAGVVQSIAAGQGDLVQQGAAVATIARPGRLRGRFGADPAVARALRAGGLVTVGGTGVSPGTSARIQSLSPAVDPQTRLAAVFVDLPAAVPVTAGEPLTATAHIGSGGSALTVPYAALLDDGGQPYVFTVAGGVAHRRDVAVGAAGGDRIAIVGGVRAADAVVTAGGTAISDGMKVRTR